MLPCYVLLDFETTGSNPVHDRITEVAAMRVEHGKVVATLNRLVMLLRLAAGETAPRGPATMRARSVRSQWCWAVPTRVHRPNSCSTRGWATCS